METQRASLFLGRWSLWLLLLGLVVPSAGTQAPSYREAVLRAVDRISERSSEANLYRLLELDPPPKDLVKQCLGTVSLDRSDDQFDINCNELQSVRANRPRPPKPRPPHRPRPRPQPWFPPRFPGKW